MRLRFTILVAVAAFLPSLACLSNPDGGCPRPGLDSARRCKRLCVLTPNQDERPLPCSCIDACLCWQMSGHPRRAEPAEPTLEPSASGGTSGGSSRGSSGPG